MAMSLFSKLTKTSIVNFITKPVTTTINIRLFSEKDPQKSSDKSTPTLQDDIEEVIDPYLPPWPNGVNPHTGERGGPRGPEPTRYGDWERKGRVSDF